jgi:hypothetical protein
MTDLKEYIDPVSIEKPEFEFLSSQAGFPHNIVVHTENNPAGDLSSFKVALIGCLRAVIPREPEPLKLQMPSGNNSTASQRFPERSGSLTLET